MNFQRARTESQIADRQSEILSACEKIYTAGGYEAVNIKEIGELVSISRSAIYSYYKTREEILLDLLRKWFEDFTAEIETQFNQADSMTKPEYCKLLATALVKRENMLQLFSIHFTILETNCRLENITAFKRVILHTFDILDASIVKFFGTESSKKRMDFEYLLFVQMAAIYPLTNPTQTQDKAMKAVNPTFHIPALSELFLKGISLLAAEL